MNGYILSCATAQSSLHAESPGFLAYMFQRAVVKKVAREAASHPDLRRLCEDHLQPISDGMAPSSLCWQPEIGAALIRLRQAKTSHAVMYALLALHAMGHGAEWDIQLEEPGRFSLGGHFFDLSGRVRVSASASTIDIEADGAPAFRFVHGDDGWSIDGDHATRNGYAPPQKLGDTEFRSVYLQPWREPVDALNIIDIVIDWPPTSEEAGVVEGRMAPRAIADQVDEALSLMRLADPCYTRWIKPLFRGIATTPLLANGMRQSGSYINHPGVFNFGFPSESESLGEGIIHEMSHQYLMVLSTVFPLVGEDRSEIYYSSLKGRKRSLDRVLLAFHACANMSLYWIDLIDKLGHRKDRDDEFSTMLAHTHELAGVLRGASGLTEAGRLLFDTQVQALLDKGEKVVAA